MTIPYIDLEAQYRAYQADIDCRIANVLKRKDFVMGQDVQELEEWMSGYTNMHAVAVSSGTDALMIPLYAMDLKENDEIITTPFTFFATVEVILFLKLKPVFVDIDPTTCNIDISQIEKVITPKTKGIISVSLFGQTSDLNKINAIAKKHKLFHIEDGAQSFGAIYNGKKSCSVTEISTTSFFPSKPMGTYGDGGMMFFKNKELSQKCASILNQGQAARYEHQYVGVNARFDTIKAAVLMAKVPYYEDELTNREEIAERYTKAFSNSKATVLRRELFTDRHVWAQYTLKVSQRDKVQSMLSEKGIPTAIHYPKPLHLQSALAHMGFQMGAFPKAEKVAHEVISIPMHAFLDHPTQNYIVESVLDVLNTI